MPVLEPVVCIIFAFNCGTIPDERVEHHCSIHEILVRRDTLSDI